MRARELALFWLIAPLAAVESAMGPSCCGRADSPRRSDLQESFQGFRLHCGTARSLARAATPNSGSKLSKRLTGVLGADLARLDPLLKGRSGLLSR